MPVEDVELVGGKTRDDIPYRFNALVIAPAVEHKPAIPKSRPIDNHAIRHSSATCKPLQLRECRLGADTPFPVAGKRRLSAADYELICAWTRELRRIPRLAFPAIHLPGPGHKLIQAIGLRNARKKNCRAAQETDYIALHVHGAYESHHHLFVPFEFSRLRIQQPFPRRNYANAI